VKLGRVAFEICEQRDKQTDTLIANTSHPSGGRGNKGSAPYTRRCSHKTDLRINVRAQLSRASIRALSDGDQDVIR